MEELHAGQQPITALRTSHVTLHGSRDCGIFKKVMVGGGRRVLVL